MTSLLFVHRIRIRFPALFRPPHQGAQTIVLITTFTLSMWFMKLPLQPNLQTEINSLKLSL